MTTQEKKAVTVSKASANDDYSSRSTSFSILNDDSSRNTFQFYVPTNHLSKEEVHIDKVDAGKGRRKNDDTSVKQTLDRKPSSSSRMAPDPPEFSSTPNFSADVAEEAARKVRSRLIQFQNQHRALHGESKLQIRDSASVANPDTSLDAARSKIINSTWLNRDSLPYNADQDDQNHSTDAEEEDDDYPALNMEPIESDDDGSSRSHDNQYDESLQNSSPITSSYERNLASSDDILGEFNSSPWKTNEYGRLNRSLPPMRQSLSTPSTPILQKSRRPIFSASEAFDFVKNASTRSLSGYSNENMKSRSSAMADINAMHAFLNKMMRDDSVKLSNDAGWPPLKKMGSFESDHGDSDTDDEGSDERRPCISMHAEEKFGLGASLNSRQSEAQHEKSNSDSEINDSDDDDDDSRSVTDEEDDDLLDHFDAVESDGPLPRPTNQSLPFKSHLYGNRKLQTTGNLNSEIGSEMNRHSAIAIPQPVLEKRTANQNLYAVETVIPSEYRNYSDGERFNIMSPLSTSFDNEYLRSESFGGGASDLHDNTASVKNVEVSRVGLIEHVTNKVQSQMSSSQGTGFSEIYSFDHDDVSVTSSQKSYQQDSTASTTEGESVPTSSSRIDTQSTNMMTKLCAHLLPPGIDGMNVQHHDVFCGIASLFIQNNIRPNWNNDDPDEPGYIVHRLRRSQLNAVEIAFDRIMANFEKSCKRGVSSTNKNFEHDLKEAEMLLDEDEKRSFRKTGSEEAQDLAVTFQNDKHKDKERRACIPGFPGIYPPGIGKLGEMECFFLPIITKSQRTGFEPAKDLVLKQGSVFASNYLVKGELGSAAFSTAYRCLDLSSEEDEDGYQDEVCLKVIKNTKDYFDQSLDEIKILQLLKDTGKVKENNIVEMKSFFYHREHLVIVTELLRENLYEFGKNIIESRGPPYFTMRRLSHIARQCLIALKFVHELGLMHCDIKPENILLGSYSRALVKIIDFGSSSFVSDRQSSYIQSRSYRAPEVILGLPYDGKIDIWSFGCVIAEMYTGEVTFQNDSELSMLSRIEAICGPFPQDMIAEGRNSRSIFTKCGLIYEKVPYDERGENESYRSSSDKSNDRSTFFYNIYQPKHTTIAARLGFDADFLEQPNITKEDEESASFIDFVSQLLTIDPTLRPTAAEALTHPWVLSSLDLSENDIRYPPE